MGRYAAALQGILLGAGLAFPSSGLLAPASCRFRGPPRLCQHEAGHGMMGPVDSHADAEGHVWATELEVGGDPSEPLSITFVTSNERKLREAQMIIDSECQIPFQLVARGDLDLDELQSDVPEKIAAAKCRLAARSVGGPVLIDDTSLCFNALGGLPGPYIKWFVQQAGTDGLVRMLHGFEDRSAWAQCSVAFSPGPGAEPCVFTGRTYGYIREEPLGAGGFGWDTIFRPEGHDMTFAEMPTEQKNAISHRGRALRQLSTFLQENKDWVDGRARLRRTEPKELRNVFSFRRRRRML
uniref:Inosine triphosphate pyrophosphatase n=1 Tax=Rhizochromulina marina TaxID=1034831 RepID=A0A7S2SC99_9STRA|mmetsp:Transcript_28075/g.82233  ORF Transcript_28075/g.82233 Transcript_28075/m.82233 type:complete len:296 (+) Transcript_28075:147-1034(+)